MDKNKNLVLNSKSDLLKILNFIPHSHVLSLATINKFFNQTIIEDFKVFHDYTLTFDCGRRGSVVGKASKGFVDNRGRLTTTRNPEVMIFDHKKIILISTSNKPLKSQSTKEALIAIAHTSISKIHFKSYRITQQLMNNISAPSSTRSSPYELDIVDRFSNPLRTSSKLPSIQEKTNNRRSRPPPARSTGSAQRDTSSLLSSPLPFTNQYSNSSLSSFDNNIMDLSLPSSACSPFLSNSSSRTSSAILGSDDYRDNNFEALLEILHAAPFESLIIGEECISWTWSNVMTALQHFNHIGHLAVHIGFERRSMPSIKSEGKWLDFIGTYYLNIPQLQSLYCDDDAFLRCMSSLSLYRNLGKHLAFIEEPQYERGSLLKNRLKAIRTNTDDDEPENATDILNGHYIKKRNVDRLHALEFVRFKCQFAPERNLSGREVEGAKVFEVSPYDSMFITVPSSTLSFRISVGGNFYDEPDDYKIVIPLTNHLKELCIYSVGNLDHIDGLYHLKYLEYVVIKKKPKNKDEFMKSVERLCKHSPIKQITMMPQARKKQWRRDDDGATEKDNNDYWQQLQRISATDCNTTNINIVVKHSYSAPEKVPHIANASRFSDYK